MNKLDIVNFDKLIAQEEKPVWCKNGTLIPHNARILIVGPSACGKTNLLFNLIFSKNGLRFKHIYLNTKSQYQDKYLFLRKVFSKMKGIEFHVNDIPERILHPNKIKQFSLAIFDDLQLSHTPQIRDYFTMGRHRNIDTAYLIQSYGATQKHFTRDNANMIVIFKIDQLSLKLIHRDYVGEDICFRDFSKLCSNVWNSKKHSFLTIMTECTANSGKYREGLDNFIDIQ